MLLPLVGVLTKAQKFQIFTIGLHVQLQSLPIIMNLAPKLEFRNQCTTTMLAIPSQASRGLLSTPPYTALSV